MQLESFYDNVRGGFFLATANVALGVFTLMFAGDRARPMGTVIACLGLANILGLAAYLMILFTLDVYF